MEAVTRLEGFLLTFSGRDLSLVKKRLDEWGYSPDSDGLKAFILDAARDESTQGQRVGSLVAQYLKDNPKLVNSGLFTVGRIAVELLAKKR